MSEQREAATSPRIVYDKDSSMGYRYRARIESRSLWRGPRWVFVIDRHFMGWSEYRVSRYFRSEQAAEDAANAWLDKISGYDGRFVTERDTGSSASQETES